VWRSLCNSRIEQLEAAGFEPASEETATPASTSLACHLVSAVRPPAGGMPRILSRKGFGRPHRASGFPIRPGGATMRPAGETQVTSPH